MEHHQTVNFPHLYDQEINIRMLMDFTWLEVPHTTGGGIPLVVQSALNAVELINRHENS